MILAFETSAKAGSVALHDGDRLLAESYQNTGRTHSQELIKSCGCTPQDIQAVAVASGPGSFTGVRIGVAAAKGFAWGADIPCYGVSTLEAMALGLGVDTGYVLPVMDARRNQVYTATFYAEKGELTRITDDRAISLEQLKEEIKNFIKPVFLVGDGSILCYNTLKQAVPSLVMPQEHRMHQRSAGVALAAVKAWKAGLPGDGAALEPNYLRLSQAERERIEKQKEKKL